jgi:octaprenyl-diphosphate synthase
MQLVLDAIAADMREVDRVLHESLDSDVVLVRQVADYLIGGGGKRLRPALLLMAAQACGYRGSHHYTLAAVVEMIHTATLLHDDVVDESELRRGKPTANARFSNAASVLVGDFLYSRSFQLMVTVGSMRVLEVLSTTTNVIAAGEVLQLMNSGNPDLSEAAYFEVIERKTAKLFEAAARLGAVIAEAPPEREDALSRYGTHLGTAFQLIDDVLDYAGDAETIGKNVGDDLREGKPTLPLIYLMENGTAEQRELVRPPGRCEAVQEDRFGQVQEGEGLQEPHPHQEGPGPQARAGAGHSRVRRRHAQGPGDAAVFVKRKTENGKRKR